MSAGSNGPGSGPDNCDAVILDFPGAGRRESSQTGDRESDHIRNCTSEATNKVVRLTDRKKMDRGKKRAHKARSPKQPPKERGGTAGLTLVPKKVEISAIGADGIEKISAGARLDQVNLAKSRRQERLIEVVLRHYPDRLAKAPHEDRLVDRFKKTAEILISQWKKDPKCEDVYKFRRVTKALIECWGSRWKDHLTDDIVLAVTDVLEPPRVTADVLTDTFEVINLCSDIDSFEIIMNMLELAKLENIQNPVDVKADLFEPLKAVKKNEDGNEPYFMVILKALNLAKTFRQGVMLMDIARKPSGDNADREELSEDACDIRKRLVILDTLQMIQDKCSDDVPAFESVLNVINFADNQEEVETLTREMCKVLRVKLHVKRGK